MSFMITLRMARNVVTLVRATARRALDTITEYPETDIDEIIIKDDRGMRLTLDQLEALASQDR